MKKNRGVLVIVLIAITILMMGCRSTVIIPERYYPEKKLKLAHTFPIDLSELNYFTLEKVIDKNKDEILFFNINFEGGFNFDKFLTTTSRDHTMYAVVFEIQNAIMNSEEIVTFIKENNGQFPNTEGLILAWEQGKDLSPSVFPKGKFVAGFSDKKNKLLKGYGKSHGVTCISRHSDQGDWLFDVGCYENKWYNNYYILFFVSEENMSALYDN